MKSASDLYIAAVRRLHFLLHLAASVPFFSFIATFGMSEEEAALAASCFLPLYLITLTLALPAAFFYLIQERVKNLGVFLLCALPVCLLYLAGMFFVEEAAGISVRGAERPPQALILVLYLLDAVRMRTNDNSRRKARVQEDHSWMGDVYLLPLPALPLLIVFAVLYVGALFLHSHELSHIALIGAILYFFLVLPYHVQVGKNAFLEKRHHLKRIPADEIQTLQARALMRVLISGALIAITALMTSGGRHFLDLPEIRLTLIPDPVEGVKPRQNALLRELMELGLVGEGAPPPEWLVRLIDFVENALTVLMTAILLYGLWRILQSVWIRFRKQYQDDPDKGSGIRMMDEHVSLKTARKPAGGHAGSRGIRRRYRKMILRSLGAPPDIYETPSMMEERAGIRLEPQVQVLHEEYEHARYSRQD